MQKAELYFAIQQYTGDASGALRGDVGVFASKEAASAVAGSPMGPSTGELCRLNVTTTAVQGQDPVVTILEALKTKFPEGALTEVVA